MIISSIPSTATSAECDSSFCCLNQAVLLSGIWCHKQFLEPVVRDYHKGVQSLAITAASKLYGQEV